MGNSLPRTLSSRGVDVVRSLVGLAIAAALAGCGSARARSAVPLDPGDPYPTPNRIHLWTTADSGNGLLVGWCEPVRDGVASAIEEVDCRLSELSFGHGWAELYEEWLRELPAVTDEELQLFFEESCATYESDPFPPVGRLATDRAAAEAWLLRACAASDPATRREAAHGWMASLHEQAGHRCDVTSRPIHGRFRRESAGVWVDGNRTRTTLRATGPFRWEYVDGSGTTFSTNGRPFEADCEILENELPIFQSHVWGRK